MLHLIPAVLLLWAAAGVALAADNSGAIQGTVADSLDRRGIADVEILIDPAGLRAKSDRDGAFHVFNLSPGLYELRFRKKGYYPETSADIRIEPDRITRLEMALAPIASPPPPEPLPAESLTVSPRTGIELDSLDIARFPAVRLAEILAYQTGVGYHVNWDEGAGLSVRGGDVDETDVLIDGASHPNRLTNEPFLNVSRAALQSVSVQKGGFDAGFGDIRSGLVNIVTRSGSADRYSATVDFAAGQAGRKHFGPHAYDQNGRIWETFAGQNAFEGITGRDPDMVNNPEYVDRNGRMYWTAFSGWDELAVGYARNETARDDDRTPQAALELWKWRHRPIEYGNSRDYVVDIGLGGPLPGGFIPLLGRLLDKTTFYASYGRERTAFPYPLTRDAYGRESAGLKLVYSPDPSSRLTISGLYSRTATVDSTNINAGQFREAGARGYPDGTVWGLNRAARYFMFENMYYDNFHPQTAEYQGSISSAWSQTVSPKTSYSISLDYQQWKTFQTHGAWRDTHRVKRIGTSWYDEGPRGFAESTVEEHDQPGVFNLSGGTLPEDFSLWRSLGIRSQMTHRLTASHSISSGLSYEKMRLEDRLKVRRGGTSWLAFPESEIPGTWWQWWDSSPERTGAFINDRIEMNGLRLDLGLRWDRLVPGYHAYDLQDRFDKNFDYNRWGDSFPVRWPEMATGRAKARWKISPRIAMAFAAGRNSSLYVNYGRYYRAPYARMLYAVQAIEAAWGYPILISNARLDWPQTSAYEVGYDRLLRDTWLLNVVGYYQDISNLPGMVTTYSYSRAIRVMNYVSRGYADRRGFELKLSRMRGRYLTGWVGYEYPVISGGAVGLDTYYQRLPDYTGHDRLNASPGSRDTLMEGSRENRTGPLPSWKFLIDFHTPSYFGVITGGWRLTLFHLWQKMPSKTFIFETLFIDETIDSRPHQETRLQLEKTVGKGNRMTFYCLVENPFNRKELFDIGGTETDEILYRDSLKLPHEEGDERGNDRWGEWDRDYIHLGFMDWYQFQNRRRFTFGARLNIN